MFFGYHRYDSVTGMLLELGLPSFNTVAYYITANNVLTTVTVQWTMILLEYFVYFSSLFLVYIVICLCLSLYPLIHCLLLYLSYGPLLPELNE